MAVILWTALGTACDIDPVGDDDAAPSVSYTCDTPVSLGAINSEHSEAGPTISPDGLELYFSSDRPEGAGDSDLWMATRGALGQAWSDPVNLGAPVNTPGGQNNPAVSPDGQTLFYGSNTNGNYDIWSAPRDGDGWGEPSCVDVLASDALENKPALSPDGELLYFKRSDDSLVANIWVSQRDGAGWGDAELVLGINDERAQTDPSIAPEGDVLFFVQGASTVAPLDVVYAVGGGDSWSQVKLLGGVNVEEATDEAIDVGPDGREFLLASDRDEAGNRDLYTFTCLRNEAS